MKTFKPIESFANGEYIGTTLRFKTCKEVISSMKTKAFVYVCGKGIVPIMGKKITANFKG